MNFSLREFEYLTFVKRILTQPHLSWFATSFFNLSSDDNLIIRIIWLLDKLGWDLRSWVTNLGWLVSSLSLAILQFLLVSDWWYLTWLISSRIWLATFLAKVLGYYSTWESLNKVVYSALPLVVLIPGLRGLTSTNPAQKLSFWYGVTWPWFVTLIFLLTLLKPTASSYLLSFNLRSLSTNLRKHRENKPDLRVNLICSSPLVPKTIDKFINIQFPGFAFKSSDLSSLRLDPIDSLEWAWPNEFNFRDEQLKVTPKFYLTELRKEEEESMLHHDFDVESLRDLPYKEWRRKNEDFLLKVCNNKLELANLSVGGFERLILHCSKVRETVIHQLDLLDLEKDDENLSITIKTTNLGDWMYSSFLRLRSFLVNRGLSFYSKVDGKSIDNLREIYRYMDLTYVEMLRTFLLRGDLTRLRHLLTKNHKLSYLPFLSENLLLLSSNVIQGMLNVQFNWAELMSMTDVESTNRFWIDGNILSSSALKANVDLSGVCAQLRVVLTQLTGDLTLLGSVQLGNMDTLNLNQDLTLSPIALDSNEYFPGKVLLREGQVGFLGKNFWWNLHVILNSLHGESPFIRFNEGTSSRWEVSLSNQLTYQVLTRQEQGEIPVDLNVLRDLVKRLSSLICSQTPRDEWTFFPTPVNVNPGTYISPVLNLSINSLKPCLTYLTEQRLSNHVAFLGTAKVILSNLDLSYDSSNYVNLGLHDLMRKDLSTFVTDLDYDLALKVLSSEDFLIELKKMFETFRKVKKGTIRETNYRNKLGLLGNVNERWEKEFLSTFDLVRRYLSLSSEEFLDLGKSLASTWFFIPDRECTWFIGLLRTLLNGSNDKQVIIDQQGKGVLYSLMWKVLSIWNQKGKNVVSRNDGNVTFLIDLGHFDKFYISTNEKLLSKVNQTKAFEPESSKTNALVPVTRSNLKEFFRSLLSFDNNTFKVEEKFTIGRVRPEMVNLLTLRKEAGSVSVPSWLPGNKPNLLSLINKDSNTLDVTLRGEILEHYYSALTLVTSKPMDELTSKSLATSLCQVITGKMTDNTPLRFYLAEERKLLLSPHSVVRTFNELKDRSSSKNVGWSKFSLEVLGKNVLKKLVATGNLMNLLLDRESSNLLWEVLLDYLHKDEDKFKLLEDEEFLMEVMNQLDSKMISLRQQEGLKNSLRKEVLSYLTDERLLRFVIALLPRKRDDWSKVVDSVHDLVLDIYDKLVTLSSFVDEVMNFKPNQFGDETFVTARMNGVIDVKWKDNLLSVTIPRDNKLSFSLWEDLSREVMSIASFNLELNHGLNGYLLKDLCLISGGPDLVTDELRGRLIDFQARLTETQEKIGRLVSSENYLTLRIHLSPDDNVPSSLVYCQGNDFLKVLLSSL